MENIILGIDIGGTFIKIGLINESGKILHKWEIPTNTKDQGVHIVPDIWQSTKVQLKQSNISEANLIGIGIGVPGFVHPETNIVENAVNIGWQQFDLIDTFKQLTNLPVYVANDANIAALGENWQGAGEQAKNLLAVTLGTGVGGGIIVNGSLLVGENGTAGEIGHITVDPQGGLCNCGRRGCLETIASATGIVHQAKNIIQKHPGSKLAEVVRTTGEITAKDVFDLAKQNDEFALNIIHRTLDILGFVIANIATMINPEKIIIGGGVSKAGSFLTEILEHYFKQYALPRLYEICTITEAKLGNDAGMIGAAYLVKENL